MPLFLLSFHPLSLFSFFLTFFLPAFLLSLSDLPSLFLLSYPLLPCLLPCASSSLLLSGKGKDREAREEEWRREGRGEEGKRGREGTARVGVKDNKREREKGICRQESREKEEPSSRLFSALTFPPFPSLFLPLSFEKEMEGATRRSSPCFFCLPSTTTPHVVVFLLIVGIHELSLFPSGIFVLETLARDPR